MSLKAEGLSHVRIARTYRGKCGICDQPIIAGQAYEIGLASNTRAGRIVHYNCHKPSSAPTWEELKRKSLDNTKGQEAPCLGKEK